MSQRIPVVNLQQNSFPVAFQVVSPLIGGLPFSQGSHFPIFSPGGTKGINNSPGEATEGRLKAFPSSLALKV